MNCLPSNWDRAERCFAAIGLAALLLPPISPAQSRRNNERAAPARDASAKDLTGYLLGADLRGTEQGSPDLRGKDPPVLAASVIVDKLISASARRSALLRGYRGTRFYHLQYHGLLGTRDASMEVQATYTAPDQRNFTIVSETGSKLLLTRVLLKALDSEKEAFQNQKQIEISPANYQFDLLGTERTPGENPCYVLGVKPRKDNKFLYHGTIWVDAHDFAVVRMQGQPAKSPSFWIKDTDIESNWERVGEFWLIRQNRSVSHIRWGGMATLTIDYNDYQITAVGGGSQGRSQSPALPDPSSVTPQR